MNWGWHAIHEARAEEKPLRELAADVLPLLRQARAEGRCPTIVEIPAKRLVAVCQAKACADAIMDNGQFFEGFTKLFRLDVVVGRELRVR